MLYGIIHPISRSNEQFSVLFKEFYKERGENGGAESPLNDHSENDSMENSTRKLVEDNHFEEDIELKGYLTHLNFVRKPKVLDIVRGAIIVDSGSAINKSHSEIAPTEICTTAVFKIQGKSSFIPQRDNSPT